MASLNDLVEASRLRFANNTAAHVMTVALDQDVYRELQFRAPNRSMYWFNVTTVPGSLTFQGDVGTFVFTRTRDMFEFFGEGPRINPYYWAEKVTAGTPEWYAPDRIKQELNERFTELVVTGRIDDEDVATYRADLDDLLDGLPGDSIGADLAWVDTALPTPLQDLQYDLWDGSYTEPTSHFLWACHAIVHTVHAYRHR